MADSASFDSLEFRRALGAFATGITVITLLDGDGKFQGLTVNSFNSVSLDPPLILWSLARETPDFKLFAGVRRFAVNILAQDQIDISQRFATPSADKFADIEVSLGFDGVPLIAGCNAALECRTETTHPGGDHLIFIGRVERIHNSEGAPLLYHQGRYMALGGELAPNS